jgi:hypothetical protein
MALVPTDPQHEEQIEAGIRGRNRGHSFEKALSEDISHYMHDESPEPSNLMVGRPAEILAQFIIHREGLEEVGRVEGHWLGGHATGAGGDELETEEGKEIGKSKSDIVVDIVHEGGETRYGVSTKTCSAKKPTNDQIYFSTASAFCEQLRSKGIDVSEEAERSMKMFCGDKGFRPKDIIDTSQRLSDDRRWFWEEIPEREEWERILDKNQDSITRLLLKEAYENDPIEPKYILHKTKKAKSIDDCEVAIFEIEELVQYSRKYKGFHTRGYGVSKGTFKEDPNTHLAPRFGFVQFQRAGNKQHPSQLQFNLKAGYFYKV